MKFRHPEPPPKPKPQMRTGTSEEKKDQPLRKCRSDVLREENITDLFTAVHESRDFSTDYAVTF
jgi:hypothetical protein